MGLGKLAALLLCVTPLSAHEGGDCDAFTWDVSRELAAMRASPKPLTASSEPRVKLMHLEEGRHFTAKMLPQRNIAFVAPPGRTPRSESPTAGLLFFKSGKGGAYRISLTSRHWIDVIDGATAIGSRDHQGRSTCKLLHKVVEFELPAQRELTIQLSGDDAATVGIVVTAVEPS
jgi:hypothetical protein